MPLTRSILALLLLCTLNLGATAQTYRDAENAPDGVISLPHELTPEERLILDEIGREHRVTPPPSAQPVRAPAEFDRMQGVLIRYPLGISTAIVREMAEDVLVYCIVTASQQSNAYNAFNSAGVNMANVIFFNANSDSYWTRDYGPWFIYDDNLDCAIADHIYNRPRPNDDQIPALFGAYLGIDVYGPDLISAGGNWMVDGREIAASTDLVWDENPGYTPAEIDEMVQDYLGIDTYHVVPDVNGAYIKHIDCWGKYLAVDKVLIREVPVTHQQYDEIEEAVAYFSQQTTPYGWPYQVYRVYTPQDQPYTNSLILNNKVLVPITGSSWDDDAIASYEAAMPGYEVLGFTGSWESTDALHCRTKGVADLEVLYLWSRPLLDSANTQEPYRVAAEIIDHSETGLISSQARVYWRTAASGPFSYEVMTAIAATDSFFADIPAQPMGTTIQYYIHAEDNSGRVENSPLVGPEGPFTFTIEIDEAPPVIANTTDLRSTSNTTGPYVVETTVTDNMGVDDVTLFYQLNSGPFTPVAMAAGGGNQYSASIPGQPHETIVGYYVHALDHAANAAFDPANAPTELYVFLVDEEHNFLVADMESGSAWTHSPVSGGYGDEWHLETYRNHTPGGDTSWKCGGAGSANYGNQVDAGLVTETVELGIDCELIYWQWIDAEYSSYYTGYAYDGGLVEINAGGGFEQIIPVGGYPYLIRNTGGTGPFEAETGVFSGNFDWHAVTFDLSAYEGPAQLRFRFGSDGGTAREGWYIDDVSIDGFLIGWSGVEPVAPHASPVILAMRATNPAVMRASFAFTLGTPAQTALQIFDAQGRLVQTLIDGPVAAGDYAVEWDRLTRTGHAAAPGVYFYQLTADREVRTTRVVLVR